MASIQDVFDQLTQANNRLQQIHIDLGTLTASTDAVKGSVDQANVRLGQIDNTLNAGFVNMGQGFQALIALETFSNQILMHHSQQHDTMICLLEQIERHTCELLNEAHVQTGLQRSLADSAAVIRYLEESAHPDATLALARETELREKIERCCPEEPEPPACTPERCGKPGQIGEPPHVDYDPYKPRGDQRPVG